ncbi:hypothetical protein U9M48_027816 [Paspalum notatum var. saurae]|uniref:Uncharacterized protein n=1 Tax=Paspalum notatum var. saurae TaxID=547442 RepID=A0AAQ3X0E7_PASNO
MRRRRILPRGLPPFAVPASSCRRGAASHRRLRAATEPPVPRPRAAAKRPPVVVPAEKLGGGSDGGESGPWRAQRQRIGTWRLWCSLLLPGCHHACLAGARRRASSPGCRHARSVPLLLALARTHGRGAGGRGARAATEERRGGDLARPAPGALSSCPPAVSPAPASAPGSPLPEGSASLCSASTTSSFLSSSLSRFLACPSLCSASTTSSSSPLRAAGGVENPARRPAASCQPPLPPWFPLAATVQGAAPPSASTSFAPPCAQPSNLCSLFSRASRALTAAAQAPRQTREAPTVKPSAPPEDKDIADEEEDEFAQLAQRRGEGRLVHHLASRLVEQIKVES